MDMPAVENRTFLLPSPEAQRPVKRQALRLNRNLALYPLARDLRRQPKWRHSKQTGKYFLADLPGDGRIRLRLPAEAPKAMHRAPTATDVAVLFAVMAEVQAAGGIVISRGGKGRRREKFVRSVAWPSMTNLIASIGLDPSVGSRARRQVKDALEFWQNVEIIYQDVWREDQQVEGCCKLPPAFEAVERRGNRVVVHVDPDWCDIAAARGYWVEIPLPLPLAPAAQNLVLVILAQFDTELKFDTRWITRKIGLDSSRRNTTLGTAIETATEWFEANSGELVFIRHNSPGDIVPSDEVWVIYSRVRLPRRRTLTRSERKPPSKPSRSERKP